MFESKISSNEFRLFFNIRGIKENGIYSMTGISILRNLYKRRQFVFRFMFNGTEGGEWTYAIIFPREFETKVESAGR